MDVCIAQITGNLAVYCMHEYTRTNAVAHYQHLLVQLSDVQVHFSQDSFDQLDRRLEERPALVHLSLEHINHRASVCGSIPIKKAHHEEQPINKSNTNVFHMLLASKMQRFYHTPTCHAQGRYVEPS
jgi:hypothetical protein